jgi:hypothetical protein
MNTSPEPRPTSHASCAGGPVVARVVGTVTPAVLRDAEGSMPLPLDGVVATVVEPVFVEVVGALVPGVEEEVDPGEVAPFGTVVVVMAPGSMVNGAEKTFGALKSF